MLILLHGNTWCQVTIPACQRWLAKCIWKKKKKERWPLTVSSTGRLKTEQTNLCQLKIWFSNHQANATAKHPHVLTLFMSFYYVPFVEEHIVLLCSSAFSIQCVCSKVPALCTAGRGLAKSVDFFSLSLYFFPLREEVKQSIRRVCQGKCFDFNF